MDINIQADLEVVQKQLDDLVIELNKINAQRDQLTQQIHNINGIAMYLRGKTETSEVTEPTDLERSAGYPAEVLS